ncbi:MAG: sulfatase-like hydrolase/transferase [Planctomycetota bacterium]|jgi:arylsulfatase A-like enzyme
MNRRDFLKTAGISAAVLALPGCMTNSASDNSKKSPPNIVYILADDLGYGDLSCFNSQSRIKTKYLDTLANQGMTFTDAHSGSAVCTPTRYGILTGRYCWRSRLKKGVLNGFSKHLIEPERMTVASMLKQQGYHTACIGKWHLGWDWAAKEPVDPGTSVRADNVDYTQPVSNGPDANGFDYYYCHSASLDMSPYVYVENGKVTAQPNRVTENKDRAAFWRKGPTGADFEHIDVLPNFIRRGVKYIRDHAADDRPFFLYLPLPAPHTPILPTKEFQGKSGLNPYADFVLQVDFSVGQIINALEESRIKENTLVIFTSDNGCSPRADFKELAKFNHKPSHVFRGYKADIFEGGHRIPFIAAWPARIKAGTTCDDTICLTDLMATCAAITGIQLPDNAGPDSVNILPDLLQTARIPLREATVHHSINGSFSIRQGKWKLELCPGSGGWSFPRPRRDDMSGLPPVQLYDLTTDISERTNVQDKHPEVVKKLTNLLQQYVDRGRSTPGIPQQNQGTINIHKNKL